MKPEFLLSKIKKVLPQAVLGLGISFVVFCIAACAIPLENEKCESVFDSTVRLRVIANSDSAEDQKLKLSVRNDIIGVATEIFKGCNSTDDAIRAVNENRDKLLLAATESVKAHGKNIPVSISFGKESCPVRRYSEFTFPAGEYLTLRINLGKAEGQNWWCVMYPPLCVSAATNDVYTDTETLLNYGFSKKDIDILTADSGQPEIKFALVEFIKGIF